MPASPGAPLRVMFGLDSLEAGGTELNAVRTAERLDPARVRVEIVCLRPQGPLLARCAAAGIAVHAFPIASLAGARTLRQGVRLARFLRAEGVEVFHAHDMYSNMFSVPWARLAGVPRVVASRRWWEGPPSRAQRIANRASYGFAHAVLANSARVGALLTGAERVPAGRVAVVPNFVDEDAFRPPGQAQLRAWRQELGLEADARVVGIVANVSSFKDHPTLLRAVALLRPRWPALRLVVAGGGDAEPLRALARTLGIEGMVRFAGARPPSPTMHHGFELSVLSSLSEGLPNSILEAMAAGRPVVATDVGATADAVEHGVTGLLVPPSDPARLAEAVAAVLADPARGRRMGRAGQARARARYSAAAALAALERLYAPARVREPVREPGVVDLRPPFITEVGTR